MNRFVESVGRSFESCDIESYGPRVVMGFYDGNTVTALWNYAQHYAMSDNSFGTTFGPSTPGAVNLVSGQTHGVKVASGMKLAQVAFGDSMPFLAGGSVISDPDPAFDDCSSPQWGMISMTGRNVGDLLNDHGITWGWFNGGFRPSSRAADGTAQCKSGHKRLVDSSGPSIPDYVAHHQPFQYYATTANPHHLPPTSTAMIGQTDQANHQYDLADFFAALNSGSLPAVSYLKASAYQDGHAGYSDPLDEQMFVVSTINALMRSPLWSSTAVIISYDDSDGWYDHVMGPNVMASATSHDFLTGGGACGDGARAAYQGRCGYGPRLPLLIVSPYARANYVDHVTTDQSSILRFIEDNFNLGRVGDHSYDEIAGSLAGMFDFAHRRTEGPLMLDSLTGTASARTRR